MFDFIQKGIEIYLIVCGIALNIFLFFSAVAIYKHMKEKENE